LVAQEQSEQDDHMQQRPQTPDWDDEDGEADSVTMVVTFQPAALLNLLQTL